MVLAGWAKIPELALQSYILSKVIAKQNKGYPVGKGLLLEVELTGLGPDWNHWLIRSQTENTVGLSRQCPQQGKGNLSRNSSATGLNPCTLLNLICYDGGRDRKQRVKSAEKREEREKREGRVRRRDKEGLLSQVHVNSNLIDTSVCAPIQCFTLYHTALVSSSLIRSGFCCLTCKQCCLWKSPPSPITDF